MRTFHNVPPFLFFLRTFDRPDTGAAELFFSFAHAVYLSPDNLNPQNPLSQQAIQKKSWRSQKSQSLKCSPVRPKGDHQRQPDEVLAWVESLGFQAHDPGGMVESSLVIYRWVPVRH